MGRGFFVWMKGSREGKTLLGPSLTPPSLASHQGSPRQGGFMLSDRAVGQLAVR